jgi:molybdopterin converting factor small subunit
MTKVKFYSLFREKLGASSIDVKGDCKLEEVFDKVVKKTNANRALFFEGNKIREEYIIQLNDKSVTYDKNVYVKDSDEVSIIPILTGG